MNEAILNNDVQAFILKNLNTNVADIALKKSPFTTVNSKELAQQIDARKRCEKKLPLWFNTNGIYYPDKVNIEQTSSQITAAYKATLIKGQYVVDASGGFGVDTYYFAQHAKTIVHCELDSLLAQIAEHNLELLGCKNVKFYIGDSVKYIKNNKQKIDTLYVDPSRRSNVGKVFKFADCEPNLTLNLGFFLQKANRIIIKAAPMLDITFGLKELKNVSAIHIVSYKNECKELLYVVDKGFMGVPDLVCVLLSDLKPTVTISVKLDDEKNTPLTYCKIKQYLYEPDAALLKAGLFKMVSKLFQVGKLNQNSHLYTATILIPSFPGRILKIENVVLYCDFEKQNKKYHANVVCRNFNLEAEAIKKKFKIGNSASNFLYFTTNNNNQKVVIECIKQ